MDAVVKRASIAIGVAKATRVKTWRVVHIVYKVRTLLGWREGFQRQVWHLRLAILPVLVLCAALEATSAPELRSEEEYLIHLVNLERTRGGLPPLTVSCELTNSARTYAYRMATEGFFGHTGPEGSTLVTRNEAMGYRNWTFLAENLAAGQPTPEEAMAALMASEPHRAIILSSRVREIGVAHVRQPGSTYGDYWVQEFGDREPIVTNWRWQRLLAR